MQFYDPNTLIAEVQELLRSYGLNPQLVDSQLAQTGAGMMLRGLNACPAIDPVDAYMSTLDKEPWPDADDRRAARLAARAGDIVSEPEGRGAAWTEERGTSDEGRRRHEGGMGRRAGPRKRAGYRA
jgi:hypothetical protein